MNRVGSFFRSSIGRKILVAATGVILIGFVVAHLVGNLQIFGPPDRINGYSHFLHELGPTLWVARIILIASAVIHIWATTLLTLENHQARGKATRYAVKHTIRATLSSRLMRWTGVVVLAFVFYHLAHFTFGGVQQQSFKEALPRYTMQDDYHVFGFPALRAGTTNVLDVHSMMVLGFRNPIISAFYIVAVGLLSYHLLHGFESLFQTLGLRSGKWSAALRKLALLFCVLYFLGNLAIPGAVLLGKVLLRPAAQAASIAH